MGSFLLGLTATGRRPATAGPSSFKAQAGEALYSANLAWRRFEMLTHKLQLTITSAVHGTEKLDAELQPAEVQILREYAGNVARLEECRLIKDGLLSRVQRIEANARHGITVERVPADPEMLAAALLWSRPLILAGNPASFQKVRDLFRKHFQSPLVGKLLDGLTARFLHGRSAQHFQLSTGESINEMTDLLSNGTFDLWLYGSQFHRDADKRAKMKELGAGIGADKLEALMENLFVERIDAVREMNERLVKPALVRLNNPSPPPN